MIAHLKGELSAIYEDRIIIEVSGIGYNVLMPYSSIELLPGIGNTVKVYTYLSVREDAMWLYGFSTKDDLDLFKLLITVNGVGPKAGLQLLSFMGGEQLKFAIVSSDSKSISKAPGVGPKTAQRIIIDLKDKIELMSRMPARSCWIIMLQNRALLNSVGNKRYQTRVWFDRRDCTVSSDKSKEDAVHFRNYRLPMGQIPQGWIEDTNQR